MIKNMKKHTYLYRLMRTMLLTGIIPLVALGVLSYQSSSGALQKKVTEVNTQLLNQTRMRFEQTLDIVYSYYVLLGYETIITDQLDQKLSYADVTVIPEIQDRLLRVQNLQSIVRSTKLVNLQENWIIHDDYFDNQIDEDTRGYLEDRMLGTPNIFWTFEESRNAQISLFIKLPYNKVMQNSAIVVDFDQKEINNYFLDEEDKKMLVIDEEGYIIYYEDQTMVGSSVERVLGKDFASQMITLNGHFTYEDYEGASRGVIYEISDYNGWTYMIVYDIDALNEDIISIRNLTLLISGVLIFAIVIIVLIGAKRLYSPVENIYDSVKNKISVDDEGIKDEIRYIGRGIDNLLEERQRLQLEMGQQITQIEELFLLKLIKGELSNEKVAERAASIGKFKDYENFAVVSFQVREIYNKEERTKDEELMVILLLNAIRNELEGSNYLSPLSRNGVVTVLMDSELSEANDFRDHIFVIAEELQSKVENRLDVSIAVGISNSYKDPQNVQMAFKESIEAIMCNNGSEDGNSILYFEDVEPGKVIRVIYPKSQEEELIQWIGKGNENKSCEVMEDIIDHIFSTHVGYNEHMIYVSRLLIAVMNVLQNSGVPLHAIFDKSDNVMDEVMTLSNTNDIKQWFQQRLIIPMIPLLAEQRTNRNVMLIQEIKTMIEEEYDQDISLEECAGRLNYHPSYIWKIMKQEMGISFTEYLLEYRLEQAKRLLTETDESVGGIAERLRYNNAQNFIRYFKKREGVTPGAYRKENQV